MFVHLPAELCATPDSPNEINHCQGLLRPATENPNASVVIAPAHPVIRAAITSSRALDTASFHKAARLLTTGFLVVIPELFFASMM
jgi:hypothetical protein